ncbi:MOLPALP family lipoprotein [[Acholeplasma] multilocale]|uniref:MOLPALP family lipoprotein n=1 Tax=[Acholeplasma] multilocale TaxID=264638 RepID=UPI000479D053|nr:MOLPALP family lipoprotein [[Acholeplasma] multilocale]
MRKMLALLGAISLSASSAATVVACSNKTTTNEEQDNREFNNSLNNLQGSAAILTKQIIMADQNNFSLGAINNTLDGKSAEQTLKNLGIDFEQNDRGLEQGSVVGELTNRYFGTGVSLNDATLSDNLKVNGRLGNGKGAISEMLPEEILGIDGDKISNTLTMVMSIAPTLSTQMLTTLLGSLGSVVQIPELKDIAGIPVDVISLAIELILKNPKVTQTIEETIDGMDVTKYLGELSVKNIDTAMYSALVNSIGKIMNYEKFKAFDYNDDASISQNLGKGFGQVLDLIVNKEVQSNQVIIKEYSLTENAEKIVDIATEIIRMVQLLQLKLSLFDDGKVIEPKDSKHLFSDKQTNNEYVNQVFETATEVKVADKFENGNLNIKYLLSSIKYYLGNIGEGDPNGYKLQKFINIMFPVFVEPKNISAVTSEKGNGGAVADMLLPIIEKYVTPEFVSMIYDKIKDQLPSMVAGIITEEKLQKVLTPSNVYGLIPSIFFSLGNGGKITQVESMLKAGFWFMGGIVFNILPKIIKDPYNVIYKGDLKNDMNIEIAGVNLFDTLIDLIPNGREKVEEWFGDKPLNLQTLATTPINKFIGKKLPIANYYTTLGFTELIKDITSDFSVDENQTLKQLENYGIRFEDIKELVRMIIGKEGEKNLISKILEDLPNVAEILGVSKEGAIEGSVWEFLVNKFFMPKHNENLPSPDLLKELITGIAKVYKKVDQPTNYKDEFVELFESEDMYRFEFSQVQNFAKTNAIKSQTLVANYIDAKSKKETKYTIKYERETKFEIFKITDISKK